MRKIIKAQCLMLGAILLAAPAAYGQGPAEKKAGGKEAPSNAPNGQEDDPPDGSSAGGNTGAASGPAATLEKALTLYDDKDYFEASKLFFEVVEDPSSDADAFRQKAEFFLGKSLYNLDYLSGSLAYFQRIAQSGPNHSYYRATLKFLAALANRFPDDGPVLDLIGLYTVDDFPEDNKEELSYLLGKNLYYQNNLDASAVLLALVTPASEYFLEAKFYESIVRVRMNDGKLASEALKEMLRYIANLREQNPGEYKKRREDLERFEDLAELTMGRVFYTTKQFQTSIKYFDRLEPTSEFWLEALFGTTWAYFQTNGFDRALGHIHTLNSPFFEGEFYPESLIVKSVIYFYNCRYDQAKSIEGKFEEVYKPVIEELRSYLEKFTDDEQFYSFVAKFRKGKVTLTPRIRRVVSIALGDKALLKQFEQIENIDKEQKQLRLDKKKWGDSGVALRLEEDIAIAKTFAIGEAGAQVKSRFQRVQTELNGLIRQGIKIKFEVANAQAGVMEADLLDEIAGASSQPAGTTPSKKPAALRVDDEHILWRFDREYWKDELGYFRSPITSMCTQR